MKRLFCVLLSFALLLSIAGCAQQTPPADTAPVNGGDARFRLTELPDVGAYAPDEKIGFFFDDGPRDSFEPREDYGRILPYIAECRDYETPEYETYTDYETGELVTYKNEIRFTAAYAAYGLMTADGRIITEGIWDSLEAITTSDGGGYYALYTVDKDNDGMNYYSAVDYAAFDGSWALHADAEDMLYMPYECAAPWLPIFTDGVLTLYDMQGQPRGRFRSTLGGKTTDTLNESIQILYADAQIMVVQNDVYDYNNSDNNSSTVATLSAEGEILHSFNAEGYLNCPAGTVFILNDMDIGKTVFNADGQRLDGYEYLDVFYSEPDRLYLTVRMENGMLTAEYHDENWATVSPAQTNWTQDALDKTDCFDGLHTKDTQYFALWQTDEVFDFYGNPVQIPCRAEETDYIVTDTDEAAGTACLIVQKTDGGVLICKPDGTLLKSVTAEDVGGEDRFESSLRGDTLAYTTGNDLHLMDITTGDEREKIHIDFFDKLDADPEKELDGVYIEAFDSRFVSLYYHWVPIDFPGFDIPGDNCIVKRGDRSDAIPILISNLINDVWLIATDEYSCVYGSDGSVLLKIPTGLYA